jgi:hypothetical protein
MGAAVCHLSTGTIIGGGFLGLVVGIAGAFGEDCFSVWSNSSSSELLELDADDMVRLLF